MRPRLVAAALALLVVAWTGASLADPKRPVPDYDGRGRPGPTPGRTALWVPRVVLSPLYFTHEYLIRRPLGTLIADAERAHLPKTVYDFLTFGPDHKAGVAPIAFWDFGFKPDFGIYFFWDDAGRRGNDLRVHATTFGAQWLAGAVTDRMRFGGGELLTLDVSAIRRPDYVFYGLGSRSLQSDESRYGSDQASASWLADFPLWRSSQIQTGMGVRSVSTYHGHYAGDPSLEVHAAEGAFPSPYGFRRGYTAGYDTLLASFDTRRRRPLPGSGVRLEVQGEQVVDLRRSADAQWLRYGATAGGYYDLNDGGRVLSLFAATRFVDPIGTAPIPFTELVSLGGSELMPGFWPGRLLGRSAAVGTLHYRWPIWVWLDGSLEAQVGNVFGAQLQGFQPSLLRFAGAIGVETVRAPDKSIELLFGIGSETFDQGGRVDSMRIVLGMNRGL
jgi:hypothetical protein